MLPSFVSFAWPLAALFGVLALIWLMQRIARVGGYGRRHSGSRLAVVETLSLDPRRRLQLVRCDARCVLLLTGGVQDLVIGWSEPASPESGP